VRKQFFKANVMVSSNSLVYVWFGFFSLQPTRFQGMHSVVIKRSYKVELPCNR